MPKPIIKKAGKVVNNLFTKAVTATNSNRIIPQPILTGRHKLTS
jgi:hypothetical protein